MKAVALFIGIVLLAIGIAGFIPALTPGGVLFGVLPLDTLRSALFAITGVVGILIGLNTRRELPPTTSSGKDLRPWM
jgi:hypothetical protein